VAVVGAAVLVVVFVMVMAVRPTSSPSPQPQFTLLIQLTLRIMIREPKGPLWFFFPIASHTPPITPVAYSLTSMLMPLHHLNIAFPTGLYPLLHPIKATYAFHFSTARATCPTHLIPIDVISLILFYEEYISRSAWLWIFSEISFSSVLLFSKTNFAVPSFRKLYIFLLIRGRNFHNH
jgi:hypothetical protein